MTVRETIAFPIDDAEFKAFQESFKKFQAQLSKTPDAFKAAAHETKEMGAGFKDMSAALLAQLEVMRKQDKAQAGMANHVERASFSWSRIARSSKETAGNIIGATTSLLKWTGIASVFGGLLGAWGFDHLAAGAGAARKSATGLGVSYGEQQAFGVTFGRVVDPASVLGGISTGKGDISSAAAASLYGLGVNPASGSTADTALATLTRVRQLALQTPNQQLGILHSSRGLGELGFSMEDLRRLKSLSSEDFEKYSKDYTKRTATLGVSDPALKAMQDFDVTLDEAEKKIKAVLIEGISKLAKPLGDLAEGVSDVVRAFLGSSGFKDVIQSITKGLEQFANYVKSEDFKKDMKDFVDSVAYAAHKMVSALKWLGIIPDKNAPPPPVPQANPLVDPTDKRSLWEKVKALWTGNTNAAPQGTSLSNMFGPNVPAGNNLGPDQLTSLVKRLEGSGAGATSPKGARGTFQITDDTAKTYGLDSSKMYDPAYSEFAARKILSSLYKRYDGNTAEILTAYNAGPGIADYLKANGDKQLPRGYQETQKYLANAGIQVTINNNTGAQVTTTTSAMGYPSPAPGAISPAAFPR